MHIAYIHQYFATPRGSTGTRSYEFARRWVAAGHRVTMLTSAAQLKPADAPQGDLGRRCEFVVEGINVVSLPVAYSQRMGKAARILAFLRFMWGSTWALFRLTGVDVVYASSTPLTVAFPAIVRRCLRGTPFVFEVRDLWPAVPHELGYIRSRFLVKLLQWFERQAYALAAAIVVLSPGAGDHVRAMGRGKRVVLVAPNCSDTDQFRPDLDGERIRQARGWANKFVCLHAGAMGLVNGLDQIVLVADRLREDPELLFVLLGDGRERPRLERMVEERGLDNVQFVDSLPKDQLPGIFAACDVSLVTVSPCPVLEHNSANKFFDTLSAGRPVLLNYSGWQRELIEREDAGLGSRQGDQDQFVRNLNYLHEHPERREEMGRSGRRLAETRFDRNQIAADVLEFVCRVAATSARQSTIRE